MKIEVLYFDGCPNIRPTLERIREVLEEQGLKRPLIKTKVCDERTAKARGFLGSPTVRIDGVDIEPSARQSTAFGIMCRMYPEDGSGVPSKRLILEAIKQLALSD